MCGILVWTRTIEEYENSVTANNKSKCLNIQTIKFELIKVGSFVDLSTFVIVDVFKEHRQQSMLICGHAIFLFAGVYSVSPHPRSPIISCWKQHYSMSSMGTMLAGIYTKWPTRSTQFDHTKIKRIHSQYETSEFRKRNARIPSYFHIVLA